jgi:hypothetical protein
MMKRSNYYLISQLKSHSLYILGIIAVIGTLGFAGYSTIQAIQSRLVETEAIVTETQTLKTKLAFISSIQQANSFELQEINTVLSRLIPNSEDYFSILRALAVLSDKTKFIVTDYNLDTSNKDKEKVVFDITGEGSREAFLNFLNNYTVGGGRLITVDELSFGSSQTSTNNQFKMSINVYAKKVATDTAVLIGNTKLEFDKAKKIKDKIFTVESATQEAVVEYKKGSISF